MFAENEQISPRQVGCIAVQDWMGKFCLLMPWCMPGISGLPGEERKMGLSGPGLAAGMAAAALLAVLVCRLVPRIRTDLFSYARERGGRWLSALLRAVCLAFLLLHLSVMLRLCASAAKRFLLPEVPLWGLLIPLAGLGIYQASAGLEVRGRLAEVGCPVLLVGFGALLLLSVFGIHHGFLTEPVGAWAAAESASPGTAGIAAGAIPGITAGAATGMAEGASAKIAAADVLEEVGRYALDGYLLFACFGGTSLILLAAPAIRKTGVRGRLSVYLYRSIAILAVFVLAVSVIGVGTFGREGFAAQEWPIVAMMSSVEVPGGFFQRWDILFLTVLFFSLFHLIGTALWGCGEICGTISRVGDKGKRAVVVLLGAAAGLASLGFSSDEQAVAWYVGGIFFCLFPIILAGILLLYVLERRRGRRARAKSRRSQPAGKGRMESRRSQSVGRECAVSSGARWPAARRAGLLAVLAGSALLLTGCGGRDIEERIFVSAMQIEERDGGLEVTCSCYDVGGGEEQGAAKDKGELLSGRADRPERIREVLQADQAGYVDFSQTKAVLMEPVETELMRAVMRWLEGEPAFARSLLVYPVDEERGLTLEKIGERTEDSAGTYLEDLWKNADQYRNLSRPLGEALGLLHKEWAKGNT